MNPLFEQLRGEIAESLRGLSASQTQLRPRRAAEKWTIQQIAQHLCLSYASTEAAVRSRLEKGRPTQGIPSIWQRCMHLVIMNFGVFPPGREAPAVVAPPQASTADAWQNGDALADEARLRIAEMDDGLDKAEATFGKTRVVSHFILGPLSVAQWRRFHRTHGLHHVKQIWAIRREHGV